MADGGCRRYLIAAGTARYDALAGRGGDLPSVASDLEKIHDLFCTRLGYERACSELGLDPSTSDLRDRLNAWFTGRSDSSDVVVLYYSGHGHVDVDDRHYLLTRDSNPSDLLGTAVETEYLARRIGSSQVRLALLLVDTCYAGTGAGEIAAIVGRIKSLFARGDAGVFVIAAARPKEEAKEGVFAEALERVLSGENEQFGGDRQPFFYPSQISVAVNQYLRERGLAQRTSIHAGFSGDDHPPFFPNPRYRGELPKGIDLDTQGRLRSMDPADLALHWGPRGRGVEIERQPGWYFSGRTKILRELVQWLELPAEAAEAVVVTGAPGVGKSAVISRLVTLADAEYRRQTPVEDVDPATLPPVGSIDIAIHAKGKTLRDVVSTIARATGVKEQNESRLVEHLATRTEPVSVVLDALDEASEPEAIAGRLLRPLTELPQLRLLVGTRAGPISRLGEAVSVKHLDAAEYHELSDLAWYVEERLLAKDEPERSTPYRDHPDLARRVAEAVARKADPVFLIARLTAEHLVHADHAVDPEDPAWLEALPTSVVEAFAAYLRRFGPEEERVRDLLLPLAYAEGEGLPWENLWAPVASALSWRNYTDADIAWVRRVAGAYLVEAVENGRSVYRLYHQALADFFHHPERDEERQRMIAHALMATVPGRGDLPEVPDWREAHPYLRHHLSIHAAAGDVLGEFVSDLLFCLTAEPARLFHAIGRANSPLPDETIDTYHRGVHALREARSVEDAASYFELLARQTGQSQLGDAVRRLPLLRRWLPEWANWATGGILRRLKWRVGQVNSVAFGRLGQRDVVVFADAGRTVRIWDVAAGEEVQNLKGHSGKVYSVAIGRLGKRQVVVSGGGDKTVRIWDADTTETLCVLAGHTDWIYSVALGRLGKRNLVVSAGRDETIRIWNADTGEELRVLRGHTSSVKSVTLGRVCQRDVVVSCSADNGNADNTVRVWDIETGEALHVLQGHSSWVQTVALARLGQRDVVVSGSADKTVRIWDAEGGETLRVLRGHTRSVQSVAFGRLGQRDVVVSGSQDATIRIWCAETGETLGILKVHAAWVESVVLGRFGQRDVVVSGSGYDVHVWDPEAGGKLHVPAGHAGPVHSVALGRLGQRDVVVSGGSDQTVRIWDAGSGEALRVLHGHSGWILAVALGRLGRHDVVVSGARDRMLRIWDANLGETLRVLEPHAISIRSLLQDHRYVCGVALGRLGRRNVVVSGVDDSTVRIWDADAGEELRVLEGHARCVNSVALGRLGRHDVVVSGSTDKAVRIWDADTGETLRILEGHNGSVESVALGRLGQLDVVVSGAIDGQVRIWNTDTAETLHILRAGDAPIECVALGRLDQRDIVVSGAWDGAVRVWSTSLNEVSLVFHLGNQVNSLSLRGDRLVVGCEFGLAMIRLAL